MLSCFRENNNNQRAFLKKIMPVHLDKTPRETGEVGMKWASSLFSIVVECREIKDQEMKEDWEMKWE